MTLAHQDRNANAAVAACRAIEHIPAKEQRPWGAQQTVPGLVIVINGGPGSEQRVIGPPSPALVAPPLTIEDDHHFVADRDE